MAKKFPIPEPQQSTADFLKEQAEKLVKETLQSKMVEMFSKPRPNMVQKDGDNLYVLDTLYDVWPDDETKGKSADLIVDIFQGRIRDYSRIYDEYDYKRAEYKYEPGGIMRFIFFFIKKPNY